MAQITFNYVTANRIEIPLGEVLRLFEPLLPDGVAITSYSYDGGSAAFVIHLAPSPRVITSPIAE